MAKLSSHQVIRYVVRRLIDRLVIECHNDSQIVIKQDSAVGSDDGDRAMTAASDLTLDITASGKNGLDTGSESSDTWYYIYMIMDTDTPEVAGLISASPTSPTLPGGFTKKRLVGAVRNNGSGNLIHFNQLGNVVRYVDSYNVLGVGASTGWRTFSVANYVAPISYWALMSAYQIYGSPGNVSQYDRTWITQGSASTSTGLIACCIDLEHAGQRDAHTFEVVTDSSWILRYKNDYNYCTIYMDVAGFRLDL